MSTVRCTSLESYRVSIAISCLLILKHCLYIRRFVQNVLEQMILLKRKGNHISVLTAARDIHIPLMWSAIASPSISIYSCSQMQWDSYIWRSDGYIWWLDEYFLHELTYLYSLSVFDYCIIFCVLSVWPCIYSSLVIPSYHCYCTTSFPCVSFVNASVWPLPAA